MYPLGVRIAAASSHPFRAALYTATLRTSLSLPSSTPPIT
uniref:Uncharacterized protein n=1 Tax=Arundo donax TaxID=35708 RepID=A0A0A9FBX7_ARUDO